MINERTNSDIRVIPTQCVGPCSIPHRDNPLAVAAKVQIGDAGGPQPQRGVEFGAGAEVPDLPRETSETSESKHLN